MQDNTVQVKSKAFALSIIQIYEFLKQEKKEFVMSKQLLRCGTSVGANIREAQRAQSIPDFYSKMSIALKEAEETSYWLELLVESNYINQQQFFKTYQECEQIIKLLVAIVKNKGTIQ